MIGLELIRSIFRLSAGDLEVLISTDNGMVPIAGGELVPDGAGTVLLLCPKYPLAVSGPAAPVIVHEIGGER